MNTTSMSEGCACAGCAQGGGCCGDAASPEALPYRAMTHGRILERMLARLREHLPEATFSDVAAPGRAYDDPAAALLDAWALMADVIAFYQERIVAEGFLPTATDDRAVRELARLIGYQPSPPAAARATLVMTVDASPELHGVATVLAGTRVQTLPGPGEQPVVFETTDEVVLRAAWNEMRPRRVLPPPALTTGTGTLEGQIVLAEQPGQAVRALTVEAGQVRIAPGHLVLFNEWQHDAMRSVAMRVQSVETLEGGVRRLVFDANVYSVAVSAPP